MLDLGMSLLLFFACLFLWTIVIGLMMLAIKYNSSKRSKTAIEEEYPYFHYPIYKKIFFIGLKRALPRIITVISFLANIFLLVIFALCLWNIFSPNVVASYMVKISGLVFFIINIFRLVLVCCIRIKL